MSTSFNAASRLIAIRAIETLRARRDRAADTKDWALYEALHAPDHRSINEDYGGWTTAAEMVANTRKAMEHLVTLHHTHGLEITFNTPESAQSICAMKGMSFWLQGSEEHWFQAFGHYYETYEKRSGAWLFTSRRLRYFHTRRSPGAIFPPPLDR